MCLTFVISGRSAATSMSRASTILRRNNSIPSPVFADTEIASCRDHANGRSLLLTTIRHLLSTFCEISSRSLFLRRLRSIGYKQYQI